jgi:hypothetical protein
MRYFYIFRCCLLLNVERWSIWSSIIVQPVQVLRMRARLGKTGQGTHVLTVIWPRHHRRMAMSSLCPLEVHHYIGPRHGAQNDLRGHEWDSAFHTSPQSYLNLTAASISVLPWLAGKCNRAHTVFIFVSIMSSLLVSEIARVQTSKVCKYHNLQVLH